MDDEYDEFYSYEERLPLPPLRLSMDTDYDREIRLQFYNMFAGTKAIFYTKLMSNHNMDHVSHDRDKNHLLLKWKTRYVSDKHFKIDCILRNIATRMANMIERMIIKNYQLPPRDIIDYVKTLYDRFSFPYNYPLRRQYEALVEEVTVHLICIDQQKNISEDKRLKDYEKSFLSTNNDVSKKRKY